MGNIELVIYDVNNRSKTEQTVVFSAAAQGTQSSISHLHTDIFEP